MGLTLHCGKVPRRDIREESRRQDEDGLGDEGEEQGKARQASPPRWESFVGRDALGEDKVSETRGEENKIIKRVVGRECGAGFARGVGRGKQRK